MAASVTLPPPGPAREFYCRVSPGRPPPDTPTDRAHKKIRRAAHCSDPCSPLLATVASVAEAAAHPRATRLRTAPAGLEPTTKTSPTRTLHQLGHAPGSICNAHDTGRS